MSPCASPSPDIAAVPAEDRKVKLLRKRHKAFAPSARRRGGRELWLSAKLERLRKHATFPAKRENIDDMTFIRTLIARMKAEHSVSDKRVYVFGYSNGGHMAFRLAIEAPDEIAAVAAVAASRRHRMLHRVRRRGEHRA